MQKILGYHPRFLHLTIYSHTERCSEPYVSYLHLEQRDVLHLPAGSRILTFLDVNHKNRRNRKALIRYPKLLRSHSPWCKVSFCWLYLVSGKSGETVISEPFSVVPLSKWFPSLKFWEQALPLLNPQFQSLASRCISTWKTPQQFQPVDSTKIMWSICF